MSCPVRKLIIFSLLLLCRWRMPAQEAADTIQSAKSGIYRTEKERFKIRPVYGIAYTQELGLLALGGFNGTYRGTADDSVPFSNIGVSLAISTKLFLMTDIKGEWFSPHVHTPAGRLRIRYNASARYMPERFYGTGYECGEEGAYEEFRNLDFGLRADFLFKFGRFLIGPAAGFDMMRLDSFTGLEDYTEKYTSLMVGAVGEFDTRDDKSSPERGVYLKSDNTLRPAFDGTTGLRCTVTADFYIPLWRGGCLAFDLYGDFSSSDSYWMNWGSFGGESRMRGYYVGRYRDRNNTSAQMELRQWFTETHGAVVWGGAGTVFPDFKSPDFSKLLPTYGAGYRLRLLGMIFRIDAGFGSHGQWSLYAGFNQAF